MNEAFDFIIVGSGAGGSAAACRLVEAGRRVLLLEKGGYVPRDGSTLDVRTVFKEGRFRNTEPWIDGHRNTFVPGEYYNVGGKTKWYGAALLRFSPHEFEADAEHQCLAWPFGYDELAPYYDEAERRLHVNRFDNEPQLQALLNRITANGAGWQAWPLPLGLKREILQDENEAKHFDGYASVCGYNSDAETSFLSPIMDRPGFTLLTGKEVVELEGLADNPASLAGVRCADGSRYQAGAVILAAGAMASPRLLQSYLERSGLASSLPSAPIVGTNFKLHINSVLLGFSRFVGTDILRKTAILFNERFRHSTLQCLGWMDGEILATQLPNALPKFFSHQLGSRAYGFFVTTENCSHPANRIVARNGGPPLMDYDLNRLGPARKEHRQVVRAFTVRLGRAGLLGIGRYLGMAGTAHALGTMVTGTDPRTSVVDANGCVHGFANLHVADGSVLPRSSRVNPALTIYAWSLRLADRLVQKTGGQR